MWSKLPECTASSLHRGQPDSGESCIVLQSWPRCQVSAPFSCRLQYANIVLQGKIAANEATDRCVQTFDAWCCGIQNAITAMWAQPQNLAWWAATQRTSKNRKTVKIGGGCLLGCGGTCWGQYGTYMYCDFSPTTCPILHCQELNQSLGFLYQERY